MTPNLHKNSVWAVAEVFGAALTLFFLYKIVVGSLGIAALGIWSLVLATTSLGRLADIGTAAGLGRFIAQAQAKNEQAKVLDYAETALLTNLMLYVFIALVLSAPAYYGLALVMKPDVLSQGRELLPYSLVSFVLMSLTSATTGAVVGQHRAYLKSVITLVGLFVQFVIAVLLVPRHGLPALAWAQIAQYAVVIVSGWFVFLHGHFGRWVFYLPCRWKRSLFKELVSFGLKLQAVSIANMLFDPAIKFTMSLWGGLEALGFYEMSQRLILQVRQLVVTPMQPIIPSFAHLSQSAPNGITTLYQKAMTLTLGIGEPLFLLVLVSSPLISILWIGHFQPTFVAFVIMMTVGWGINLLAVPAYFLGIGTGHVKGNFYGACVSVVGGILLGLAFGYVFGAYGVAFSASVMLGVGAWITLRLNCRAVGIPELPALTDVMKLWKGLKHPRNVLTYVKNWSK